MCAQCHNKKDHIHTTKSTVANKATVTVVAATTDCCSSVTSECCSTNKDAEGYGDNDTEGPAASGCCSTSTSDAVRCVTKKSSFTITGAHVAGGDTAVVKNSHQAAENKHSDGHDHALDANGTHEHHHNDHVHSGHCCSAPSMSKQQELALEASLTNNAHGKTFSWKVLGMDCPSCAAKLEKAIMALAAVDTAKVMFATEKLIVNLHDNQQADAETLKLEIENKAKQTGFTLVSSATKAADLPTQSFFSQHLTVIVIALMMVISFVLNKTVSAEAGLLAFTLTTIVGLFPILKKAVVLTKSGTPFSIETLMSVAAIGALYLGETAEAAMVILLFLIGEQLEGYAASRARSGVKALMDLVPEEATVILADGSKPNYQRLN